MRRRRHHFRVSPFSPEIKAVLAVLDHFDKIFETSPEMKKVIFYLRLQAILTLKIEISPVIKFLIDVREGKEVRTETREQEYHWWHSTFKSEFKEIIPTLKELVLLNTEQPLIRWWIKWDIDWLHPDQSIGKEELREFGKWVSLDVVGVSYARRAVSAIDRFLAFSSRWPNFHAKELDNLLNTYRQTLLELSSADEQVSEYISKLEKYRKGILQDEMTRVCGNIKKLKMQKKDSEVWSFWISNLNITQKEVTLRFYPSDLSGAREMKVSRALNRVHKAIYGTKLPKDSKDRKMLKFEWHLLNCEQCQKGNPCQQCEDYQKREIGSQREWQRRRVRRKDSDKDGDGELYLETNLNIGKRRSYIESPEDEWIKKIEGEDGEDKYY